MCSVKGKEIMENMKTLITFYELGREALETGEKKRLRSQKTNELVIAVIFLVKAKGEGNLLSSQL